MKDFSVLIIDNGSQDETVEFLEKEYGNRLQIIKNEDNQGFAKAHNQGMEIAKGNGAEYVLITNPDIILTPNFLEKLILEADKRPDVGSFGGKLLRIVNDSRKIPQSPLSKGQKKSPNPLLRQNSRQVCQGGTVDDYQGDIIDSAGLKIFKNRRVVEIGAGEKDAGQYNNGKEVFGISGALALYRVKALEEIKLPFQMVVRLCSAPQILDGASADAQNHNQIKDLGDFGEYFDNDFFAYKEDVDLAWRMKLYGWKSFYVPEAMAFHYRGATSKENISNFGTVGLRKGKPQFVNYLSYRNNLLMLFKNDYLSNFLIDFPRIFWYELRKFGYILFFERKSLKVWISFFKLSSKMRQKRKFILTKAKVERRGIRKWFN
jgi:GT2 family glycosyltransferase